jgi:hypothetical protein
MTNSATAGPPPRFHSSKKLGSGDARGFGSIGGEEVPHNSPRAPVPQGGFKEKEKPCSG